MTALSVGIFGQSFAEALLANPARGAFTTEFARAGYSLNIVGHGTGGASILKENAPPTMPTRYFWDLDLMVPGPALTNALAAINASPHKPITRIIFAQGEADSVFSGVDTDRYRAAYAQVVWKLKQACYPGYPNSVGVTAHIIGRRLTGGTPWPGVQKVREAQLQMIDNTSLVYGFDTFDLPLLGDDPLYPNEIINTHMDTVGNAVMGWRAAQRILQSVGKPYRTAPSVASITRIDACKISLAFSKEVGTVECPSHFAVRDADVCTDLEFEWVDDCLTIEKQGGISGKLLYPYGDLNEIDRSGLIRDGHGTPLQSLAMAIPD